jgi:hypothetical protein
MYRLIWAFRAFLAEEGVTRCISPFLVAGWTRVLRLS